MSELNKPEALMRQMYEVQPFRIGQRVTVQGKHAGDYPGEWVIVGMRWEYKEGDGSHINFELASDDEIINRWGSTDGFRSGDLVPVIRS